MGAISLGSCMPAMAMQANGAPVAQSSSQNTSEEGNIATLKAKCEEAKKAYNQASYLFYETLDKAHKEANEKCEKIQADIDKLVKEYQEAYAKTKIGKYGVEIQEDKETVINEAREAYRIALNEVYEAQEKYNEIKLHVEKNEPTYEEARRAEEAKMALKSAERARNASYKRLNEIISSENEEEKAQQDVVTLSCKLKKAEKELEKAEKEAYDEADKKCEEEKLAYQKAEKTYNEALAALEAAEEE